MTCVVVGVICGVLAILTTIRGIWETRPKRIAWRRAERDRIQREHGRAIRESWDSDEAMYGTDGPPGGAMGPMHPAKYPTEPRDIFSTAGFMAFVSVALIFIGLHW